jgi:hypothetical protein
MEDKMKALSWREPYGSMMLHGKIETRTWYTKVRGPILICCSQKGYSYVSIVSISGDFYLSKMKDILDPYRTGWPQTDGMAIGIGTLTDCHIMRREEEYLAYVRWHPELYSHVYEDVIPLPSPFKVKGQMGFFEVPDSVAGFNLLGWYEKMVATKNLQQLT